MQIRQAAAVNLKNLVQKNWREKKNYDQFVLYPEDKANIRANFLDALLRAADEKKIR